MRSDSRGATIRLLSKKSVKVNHSPINYPLSISPHTILLSIDPGLTQTGWAAFRGETLFDYGVIRPRYRSDKFKVLVSLQEQISGIITKIKPDVYVVEVGGKRAFTGGKRRSTEAIQGMGKAQAACMIPANGISGRDTVPSSWKGRKGKESAINDVAHKYGVRLERSHHDCADAILLGEYYINEHWLPA